MAPKSVRVAYRFSNGLSGVSRGAFGDTESNNGFSKAGAGFEPANNGFAIRPPDSQAPKNKVLTESEIQGAAQTTATGPKTDDERLARLVQAWPDLPEPIRAGIAAMVEVTDADNGALRD